MIRELVNVIIALVFYLLVFELLKRNMNEKYVVFFGSVIYMFAVIYLTMFRGGRTNLSGVSIKIPLPFYRAVKAHCYGLTTNRSLLNLLLFVPFGYLLPRFGLLLKRKLNFWKVTLLGFIFSLLIEICQLVFHRGVFELDDLVKNTMGAAVGYAVWKMLNRRKKNDVDR